MNKISRDKLKQKGFKRLLLSFKYAVEGIVYTLVNEQNMIIHFVIAFMVILFGIIFKITKVEWLFIIIAIGLVLASELINSAFEATIDFISLERNPLAKIAKDTASGAVFILALTAAIIGMFIYIPYIIDFIK